MLVCPIWAGFSRPSWAILLLISTFLSVVWIQMTTKPGLSVNFAVENGLMADPGSCSGFFHSFSTKKVVSRSIIDFGGVGDGKTINTDAFRRAIEYLKSIGTNGIETQLYIPRGNWLTGSFNLTSNFTLYLEDGAMILGSQDPKDWPLIEPLPSYGRGREREGGRHISLIHGDGLQNVVITGRNGKIDGQGRMWWELWWNRSLVHTRGHLIEFMNSRNVLIFNLTLLNSPFWTIHPVYCSNVVIKKVTILAPLNSPNTDGIDPDSSSDVCIEDCYIESGDDLVAVKSGWDQYGIAMNRPSSNIIIRKVSGTTPTCSGLGIGSEMSGGISNVRVENMNIRDSASGIRIKTDKGRGGYIANITISNITMENVKIPIRFSRGSNDHPDNGYDPKVLPIVRGIYISNVVSVDTGKAPVLQAINGAPFEDICLNNIRIEGIIQRNRWQCEFVSGSSFNVFPVPCFQLQNNSSHRCDVMKGL